MRQYLEAFLDIETTGLSPEYGEITVVGIHRSNGLDSRFVQLVWPEITADSLSGALAGVDVIYTYNGSRFDLPFICSRLGLDLNGLFRHHDLMYDCWRKNLYGGLKCVEKQLGIPRRLVEVNGYQAVVLWWRYIHDCDRDALAMLLDYNREDVINLKALKEVLL
ncbi:MAG: ribonuclease H-like domain-containing protein [Dehalococcoidales bacterium]|nr:ribonuclease H-like domain-containing protein [Dehalococcoidales bacterium]